MRRESICLIISLQGGACGTSQGDAAANRAAKDERS